MSMKEDAVISNTKTKTVEETHTDYRQSIAKQEANIDDASKVLNAAGEEYNKGVQSNAANPNSGLNTTVAKDSHGNAIGTYDWEAQADHTAKISYNSDVLAAKQDATSQKADLVTNQQQGQVQYDMAGYAANQSAEKAGWTGGYILDSNRQVAFLKESIKANLYSQEELQKYGYDTALAAARANYDAKKAELAMTNYNTAVQNAFQMAEFTGKFISPEASFHLSQLGAAEKILADGGSSTEDKQRAEEIKTSVESWFEGNKISKQGVYCISVLMDNYNAAQNAIANLQNTLNSTMDSWNQYKVQLMSAQESADAINEETMDTGVFAYVDEYGIIQRIQANFAAVATDKTEYTNMFNSLPKDAQATYTSKLTQFVSDIVVPTVEANISGKKFTSKENAEEHVNYALKQAIESAGITNGDISIKTFKVTCNVNGQDIQIEVGGNTVTNHQNVKTPTSTPIPTTQHSYVITDIRWHNDNGKQGPEKGNNFSVTADGITIFRVQYGDKADDTVQKLGKQLNPGEVILYGDKVYIKYDDTMYTVDERTNSFKKPNQDGYDKLKKTLEAHKGSSTQTVDIENSAEPKVSDIKGTNILATLGHNPSN